MELNEYQKLAQRTSNTLMQLNKITNGCMGLCGESGKCMDLLKKYKFQGHAIDKDKMIEECGDVLWYVSELASGLGVTLEEVAEKSIKR